VTLVTGMGGRLVGATQFDARTGLLRALFVDAGFQVQGVGPGRDYACGLEFVEQES